MSILHPVAVLVRAPGGAGKSTIGDTLANRISNVFHIDYDRYKPEVDIDTGVTKLNPYGLTVSDAQKDYLQSLRQGRSVIVSECFLPDFKDEYDWFRFAALDLGVTPYSFFLDVALEDCLARNRMRAPRTFSDNHITKIYELCNPYDTDYSISNRGRSAEATVEDMIEIIQNSQERSVSSKRDLITLASNF